MNFSSNLQPMSMLIIMRITNIFFLIFSLLISTTNAVPLPSSTYYDTPPAAVLKEKKILSLKFSPLPTDHHPSKDSKISAFPQSSEYIDVKDAILSHFFRIPFHAFFRFCTNIMIM